MTNRQYIRGVAKEREILNYFRSNGYIGIRSAGSKSLIDLVLIPTSIALTNKCKAIQVKRVKLKHTNLSNLFPEALELAKLNLPNNIDIEFWVYIDYEGWEIYSYNGDFKLIRTLQNITDYLK